MKRKFLSILLALTLVLSFSLVTAVPVGAQTTWTVGDDVGADFLTIQAAIDHIGTSPGDTIIVAAGTYDEQVAIDKALTLISDTGDYRTTETILTGSAPIFDINADGITVQGFRFNDVTGISSTGAIQCRITAHDIVIQSNSFTNLGGPAVFAMPVGLLASTGWLITDNKIDTVTFFESSGLRFQRLTDSEISYNEISNTAYAGMILDNLENVVVLENTISNTPRKGIQVAVSSNVVIEENYITNTNTSQDADEGAITIYPDVTNIRIENNTLTANYQGFTVRDKAGTVFDVHVNFNNIYGNDGFGVGNFAQGGGIVDAENNWWGSINGPTHAGNTFNVGYQGDAVSDNVLYVPWHDTDMAGTSFAPVTLDEPAGQFSSIQAAIDAATGTTITCAAGTYLQDDQINVVTSSLTIQGAGKGNTIVRRAGTPVYGQYWRVFDVSAESDVTISDMTVGYETLLPAGGPEETPVPGYVIAHGAGYSPTNNLIIDNVAFDGGRSAILSSGTGLVVQYCSFTGEWQRPCIRPTGADFLITWNNFQELHYKYGPVQLSGGATSGEISYNQFSNGAIPGYFSSSGAVFTVEVYIGASPKSLVIKGNTFDGITGHTDTLNYKGNAHKTCAIYVELSSGEGNILVQDNTFFGYDKYAMLFYESSGIIVTNNSITENLKGIVVWGEGCTGIEVHFNDIFGNSEYGVEAGEGAAVDALYNWWGNATGPDHATLNPGAEGNAVSDNVLFSPWLYEPQGGFVSDAPFYAGSVVLGNEATLVDIASYAGGWNSFSTPVTLAGSANTWDELLDLVDGSDLSIVRAQRFDPATQLWVPVVMNNSLVGGVDYPIKPGEGFFIQVSTKGSLPILCSTIPTSPPMTYLLAGWNLVGLSNLVSMSVADAFYGIFYSVVLSALPPNAFAWSVPPEDSEEADMLLGEAYWVAMGQPGILFGFTTTPVADNMTWELNK